MISRFRGRISSAHVIAVLALFIALGGGAYAGSKIGSNQIKKNAVTAAKIKKNAVTTAKIKKNAVSLGRRCPDYFELRAGQADERQEQECC